MMSKKLEKSIGIILLLLLLVISIYNRLIINDIGKLKFILNSKIEYINNLEQKNKNYIYQWKQQFLLDGMQVPDTTVLLTQSRDHVYFKSLVKDEPLWILIMKNQSFSQVLMDYFERIYQDTIHHINMALFISRKEALQENANDFKTSIPTYFISENSINDNGNPCIFFLADSNLRLHLPFIPFDAGQLEDYYHLIEAHTKLCN